MKLLFDQNISVRIIRRIDSHFPQAEEVKNLGLENASDEEIWTFAKNENYVIVTFDSDFFDLSVVWGHPPKIIWLRTTNQTTPKIEEILKKNMLMIKEFVSKSELGCLEIT